MLAAFVGVCVLADVSPLAKLHPPSVVFSALVGAPDGPRATLLFALLVAITVAAPALAVWWTGRRRASPAGRGARVVNASIVMTMFAVAWLMEARASSLHAVGRGSDQSACIVMPARALASFRWPYDRSLIWSGNACSPGMGWIALAIPFVLVAGYASFLVAGAAVLVALPERVLGARTLTATLLLTLSCVTAWQSLATGADDLAIGIGLALVTALSGYGGSSRITVVVGVAAGLLATARLPFAFVPFVLAASLYAEGERRRGGLLGAVAIGTLVIAHAVPLAFNARSYIEDGPFHVLGKAARIEGEGGTALFAACGLAWIAYAAWALRRASRGGASPVTRQFDIATLTLLSVAAPALSELFVRARAAVLLGAPDGLQRWEGGNWLLTALPCYATALALAFHARQLPCPEARAPEKA